MAEACALIEIEGGTWVNGILQRGCSGGRRDEFRKVEPHRYPLSKK